MEVSLILIKLHDQ